jgi:hypothetical protein
MDSATNTATNTAMNAGDGTLADLFASSPSHFVTSPLYCRLVRVVAADERLLAIAAQARPGQLPQNVLLASVHYLLLRDRRDGREPDELAAWYPSLGGTATGDPGPAFTAFCLRRRAEITDLVRHRLVQTNVVKRVIAVRLGMAEIASLTGEPVTFIEVGCSAGAHLRFDEYRCEFGGRTWGKASSPVVVSTVWRDGVPPALGPLPAIRDRVGIDLHPVDVTDPDERLWLRALVWPENAEQGALQAEALRVVADDPPRTVCGDMVDVLSRVVAEVPRGTPVVVFHAATRLHVAAGRREAFDAAIADVARDHELFHLSYEMHADADEPAFGLVLRRDAGPGRLLAIGDGHGAWMSAPV